MVAGGGPCLVDLAVFTAFFPKCDHWTTCEEVTGNAHSDVGSLDPSQAQIELKSFPGDFFKESFIKV